jgi:hypothetical protein
MRTTALFLLYTAATALGIFQTFRPTVLSGFESVQTDRSDGMLNHYILENSWLSITDSNYCGSLITPPFCFPERGTLYYSENLFGTAPVYWALRLVLPGDLAYISWQMVLSVLNFVTFAVVARWLKMSHLVALAGAYLWAFGMVHVDQIMHQQMIPRLWMPFAVYYAIMLVTEPSAKALNRLMGCSFLQCFACFYTGWFLVVGLLVFIPAMMLLRPSSFGGLWRFVRGHPFTVLGIFTVWTLAMVALFAPYMVFSPSTGHGYDACYNLMPTPAGWITGPIGSYWHETLDGYSEPKLPECKVFCGFGVYALMFGALVGLPLVRRKSEPVLGLLIVAGLITAVVWWLLTVATAADGDSLWRWVRFLPGGRAVRLVARVYVIVYLFGTFAGLAWLDIVTRNIRREWIRVVLLGAIAVGLIWEQTGVRQVSFKRTEFYTLVDKTAEDMKGAEVGYVVPRYTGQSPFPSDGEVFGMWVGLRANVPVVNGYSGVLPPNFVCLVYKSDDEIRTWLRGRYRGKVRVVDQTTPGQYREFVVE